MTQRVEQVMGRGNGVSTHVRIRTNNADNEGTTATLEKVKDIHNRTKQARVGHIILL